MSITHSSGPSGTRPTSRTVTRWVSSASTRSGSIGEPMPRDHQGSTSATAATRSPIESSPAPRATSPRPTGSSGWTVDWCRAIRFTPTRYPSRDDQVRHRKAKAAPVQWMHPTPRSRGAEIVWGSGRPAVLLAVEGLLADALDGVQDVGQAAEPHRGKRVQLGLAQRVGTVEIGDDDELPALGGELLTREDLLQSQPGVHHGGLPTSSIISLGIVRSVAYVTQHGEPHFAGPGPGRRNARPGDQFRPRRRCARWWRRAGWSRRRSR